MGSPRLGSRVRRTATKARAPRRKAKDSAGGDHIRADGDRVEAVLQALVLWQCYRDCGLSAFAARATAQVLFT